ncbi:MAG: hypothetical protein ACK5MP_07880 [Nostocoides sp.]
MQRVDGDGFFIEWDSDGDGYARIVVMVAEDPQSEAAKRWLPQSQWLTYEFRGETAFEDALKASLNDIWPERVPYRIP